MEPNVKPKPISLSEKIRVYTAKHPAAKAKEVAEALGVKMALIYAVRKYDRDRKARLKAKKKSVTQPTLAITVEGTSRPAATTGLSASEEYAKLKGSVYSPPHYMVGGIETIRFIEAKLTRAELVGYLKGNIIKYSSRIGHKGDAGIDAGKLAWYAAKLRSTLSTAP